MAEKITLVFGRSDYIAGITAARERYNEDNPDKKFETNTQYVQFVMDSAARSYATQYGTLDTSLDPAVDEKG